MRNDVIVVIITVEIISVIMYAAGRFYILKNASLMVLDRKWRTMQICTSCSFSLPLMSFELRWNENLLQRIE